MLNHIENLFDNMTTMMKKLKKQTYKDNMNMFREKNDPLLKEMADYMEREEDKDDAAKRIAEVFIDAVQDKYSKHGKVKGRTQADLNFFMIYYVFPSILLTSSQHGDLIAQSICRRWGSKFKNSNIGYANYDKIYDSFRSKIFGIF